MNILRNNNSYKEYHMSYTYYDLLDEIKINLTVELMHYICHINKVPTLLTNIKFIFNVKLI